MGSSIHYRSCLLRALPAGSWLASLLNKDERLKIELRQEFGQAKQPFPGLGVIRVVGPVSAREGELSCLGEGSHKWVLTVLWQQGKG